MAPPDEAERPSRRGGAPPAGEEPASLAPCPAAPARPAFHESDEDGEESVLYGRFTWRVERFSEVEKGGSSLRSSVFDVGGYKW